MQKAFDMIKGFNRVIADLVFVILQDLKQNNNTDNNLRFCVFRNGPKIPQFPNLPVLYKSTISF